MLGLAAVLLTVILWAVAANVASNLFATGVSPFELAAASSMIATWGLALLDSFLGRSPAKAMNWQQFALGLLFAFVTGTNYLAIARLPVAVAVLLLFTSPIMDLLHESLGMCQFVVQQISILGLSASQSVFFDCVGWLSGY